MFLLSLLFQQPLTLKKLSVLKQTRRAVNESTDRKETRNNRLCERVCVKESDAGVEKAIWL